MPHDVVVEVGQRGLCRGIGAHLNVWHVSKKVDDSRISDYIGEAKTRPVYA